MAHLLDLIAAADEEEAAPANTNTTPPKSSTLASEGAWLALRARGAQDKYLFYEDDDAYANANADYYFSWDVRPRFLTKRHTVTYCRLPTEVKSVRHPTANSNAPQFVRSSSRVFTLRRTSCDLVNGLDLVLRDPDGRIGIANIHEVLRTVEVQIGGQRIDKMWFNYPEVVDAWCALHGRRVERHSDLVFVPLPLAPLQAQNLLSLAALEHHEVHVCVHFVGDQYDAELYGNAYYLEDRALATAAYEMGVAQMQYAGGCRKTREGGGASEHELSFNHPVTALMLWGFDRASVVNVKLTLDGLAFYDGPLAPLERAKADRGLGHVAPSFIFFSAPGTSPSSTASRSQATVNFTRIDKAVLHLETAEGTPASEVEVYACSSLQPLRIAGGMAGLAFSK
jgi:hypothetical protein